MFSRFSPASKRVLRAAEQECRNLNHYYVGVEHVLLALLEQHDPQVDVRLAELGVRNGPVEAEIRRSVGSADDRVWDGILITPRVRSVIQLAEEAKGSEPVEPLDLFEAILREGRSAAAEILAQAARNASGPAEVGS